MQEHGTSSVKCGKVEGLSLELVLEPVLEIIKRHPRGILDIATLDEVTHALRNNLLDVWVAANDVEIKFVALTQTSMFASSKTMFVVWIGGTDFSTYAPPLLEKAEKWCALHQIKHISASATRGWAKRLMKIGFTSPRVELIKPVGFLVSDTQEVVRKN